MRWIACLIAASTLASPAEELTTRFLTRSDLPLTSYVAWRRLEARNQRFKVDGWLEACVSMDGLNGFQYRITREGGSGYIRNKVLRKALDGERDLIASGDVTRSALSPDNYQFERARMPSPIGEAVLLLTPRRSDGLLITGRAIVTDPEADLIRVEGRLTKNPSFWTRSVDVMRRYEWRGGVRVPVDMTSTAEVRLVGRSSFRMSADYLVVNGANLVRPDSAGCNLNVEPY